MNNIAILLIVVPVITICAVFALDFMMNTYLGTNIFYILFLAVSGNLMHHIEKRRLVKGDLVIINFRGKYRKAYVLDYTFGMEKFQVEFEDAELQRASQYTYFPISRIIVPKYLSKAAKVLYTEVEKKR